MAKNQPMDDMESKEREAYRMKCKHYGTDGVCWEQPHSLGQWYGIVFAPFVGHITKCCTPDCDCARMRRYDKRNKL